MGRARDIANVLSSNTALATDAEIAAAYAPIAAGGLVQITPTSIANTNGTASIGSKGTVTFNAVNSLSLNGVFTSTYRNYKIFWTGRHSTDTGCLMRLRANGTDSAAGDTSYVAIYANNGGGPTRYIQGLNSAFETGAAWSQYNQKEITLSNPTDTTYEKMFFLTFAARNGSNFYEAGTYGGWKASNASFDGFSLIPSAGTMLGQVSVYGIRE
jgi:hypothetical protein